MGHTRTENNMQERTGRIEDLKILTKSDAKVTPSLQGTWVELSEEEYRTLSEMNRKQRRKWMAEQRAAGRNFKELEK